MAKKTIILPTLADGISLITNGSLVVENEDGTTTTLNYDDNVLYLVESEKELVISNFTFEGGMQITSVSVERNSSKIIGDTLFFDVMFLITATGAGNIDFNVNVVPDLENNNQNDCVYADCLYRKVESSKGGFPTAQQTYIWLNNNKLRFYTYGLTESSYYEVRFMVKLK